MIQPQPAPAATTLATLAVTVYGCGEDEAALFAELAPRLGVEPTLVEADVCAANAALAAGGRCVSVGHKARVDRDALLALRRAGVAYLSTRSIGCNHIDVAYAQRIGIRVGNVAYSPDSVADYTLMLILMGLREMRALLRRVDAGDYRLPPRPGRELRDLTVGVVGTGRIGAAVIARLHGFGCRVLAHDPRPAARAEYVALDELVRRSDVVTLHTPLTPATHHLLDHRRIAALKRGAFVVNTGRGGLVDTAALAAALEAGTLGGAALDVVEGEEGIFYADCRSRDIDSALLLRLQRLPNVIVSPHTAYFTDHALRDAVEDSLRNCLRFAAEDHDA